MHRLWLPLPLLAMFILAACANDPDSDYVDAMAEQHADDLPIPSGTPIAGEDGLVTARVPYHDGATGYLAYPGTAEEDGTAPLPALIVIHEWWGLNENIEAETRRLANEGYRALAVDLYEGDVAVSPDSAQVLMQTAMNRSDALFANLASAAEYLQSEGATRIGVIGWCFGGAWSLRTALALPERIDATVIYYGRVETDIEALAALDAPVLGLFGANDQGIPSTLADAFDDALDVVDVPHTVRVFEKAGHAFANPSGRNYQPEAAEAAWAMTTDFLAEHLQDG